MSINQDRNLDQVIYAQKYSNKSRTDLNDLLVKAKERKKQDNKINLIIISGAASFAAIVLLFVVF